MCSFPHFSPTCFEILSWNYAYFVLIYYRSSSSVVTLHPWLAEQEVRGYIPRLATWISEIGYLPLSSRDMTEIPLKRRKSSRQPTNQPTTLHPSGSPSVHPFSAIAPYMHWQLSWNFKFDFCFFNAFLLEKYYIKIACQNVHDGRIMHRLRYSDIFLNLVAYLSRGFIISERTNAFAFLHVTMYMCIKAQYWYGIFILNKYYISHLK